MTSSQRLSIVRQLVESWCRQREPEADLGEMTESILIRGGFYCGRRLNLAGYSAVWFAEEDQIKLFDAQGELIDALTIDQFQSSLENQASFEQPTTLPLPARVDQPAATEERRAA